MVEDAVSDTVKTYLFPWSHDGGLGRQVRHLYWELQSAGLLKGRGVAGSQKQDGTER